MSDAIPMPTNYRFQDLTGRTFGKWKVLRFAGRQKVGQSGRREQIVWECECSCGFRRLIPSHKLFRMKSGCRRTECRSLEERLRSRLAIPETEDGCWEWQGKTTDREGYGRVTIGQKYVRAHRLAYELWVGSIPPGMVICHACDNPRCCRPSHLFPSTPAGNAADRDAKERQAKGKRCGVYTHPESRTYGERCSKAKLTEEKVRIIRARKAQGERAEDLAREFHLNCATIRRIVARTIWKHIP